MASRLMSMHDEHVASKPPVKPRALIVIADGSDELETLVLSDILTRGDLHVSIASVGRKKDNLVGGSFGMKIKAEHAFEDCSYRSYELIVLPGGLGTTRLRNCDLLAKMLRKQRDTGKWYAAISSAPAVVLKELGLLPARATCDMAHERLMLNQFEDEAVVVEGKCVTSQGPGTAIQFALKLVELLCGREEAVRVAKEVRSPMP